MTAQSIAPAALNGEQLRHELSAVVMHGATQRPRDMQTAIGPSGLGEPCTLRLAYSLLDWPKSNPTSDPLPSVVGTGAHAQFAEFFERNTETLPDGRRRYLVEQRVTPEPGIPGNADLFDRLAGCVIDWKFLGKTKLDDLRRKGPGLRYRVQSHTYGLGFENAGEQVRHVAVVGVPRGGFLAGMTVWTEPYDRQIALDALARRQRLIELLSALDVEENPTAWDVIERDTSRGCRYCPFFLPGSKDRARGCPGHISGEPVETPTAGAFLGTSS
jgi:hypothetical protein